MNIYIHTLGRANRQISLVQIREGCALAEFPISLVVQAPEKKQYEINWSKHARILALPDSLTGKGLSATRQWLLENAETDRFVMMDDDLRFSSRRGSDYKHLHQATHGEVAEMFRAMFRSLAAYPQVAISPREGNNRVEVPSRTCERAMRVLGFNRALLPPVRFDRVRTKQDFDMTLQILRAGRKNLVFYRWAQDQAGGSNSSGGCSLYRTEEMNTESAKRLAELHPGFVTLVTKASNNWKNFGDRLEVRIQWKKAYKEGIQK